MTSTPVEVGTLIVVILKAKNLPNKRHIGKQDPYCSVKLNNETRRTKAVKRGGQHPEWDEEVRFTIVEDVEDELARTAGGDTTDNSPPPPPPKKDKEKEKKKIKGPKQMQLMCYADDPREPSLIGETMVDLTEVLTKGETDEWFTLANKEKYCGEVYLELTFWSNEKPPEKRTTPASSAFHPQYGGPGSFTPSTENPSSLKHGSSNHNTPSPSRIPSSSGPDPTVPPSLRPSGSLAQINLYTAPYEKRNRYNEVDKLSNDLADLSASSPTRRRESFPPVQAGISEFGYTGGDARQNGSYSTISSLASVSSVHSLGPPVSGNRPSQGQHRYSLSSLPEPFSRDEYFPGLPHSIQPVPESYPPQTPYQYQQPASGFVQPPPLPQTPGPAPSQFGVPSSATPAKPSTFVPPPLPSSAMSFHPPQPQPYPAMPQTPFQYPAYSQAPMSAPPLQYLPQDAPLPPPVPSNSLPAPQQYGQHASPSPPHQHQQASTNAYQHIQPGVPPSQQYGQHATPSPPHQHQQPLPSPNAFQQTQPGAPPSQQYGQHATPSPPHQHQQPPPPPNAYKQIQPSGPPPQSSRPLPNPQAQYQSRQENQSSSTFTSPPPGPTSSMGSANMAFPNPTPFQPPGPPPPPPARRGSSLPPSPSKTLSANYPPPPPPPPLQNGVYQPHVSHLNTPPPPPPSLYQNSNTSPSPHGSQSLQSYTPQQPQQSYPPQQAQQPYPSQQSQGYGSWAPPPPPPASLVSGFSSPPHPSSFSTPPPQQPYYPNSPSGPLGWNTPPRQNPPQHDGWRS